MRYERNKRLVSEAEQGKLSRLTASIVGLGGLGCYIVEELTRLGIGCINLIDSESFDATNLNRQLYAHEGNLGRKKTAIARERMTEINSGVRVLTHDLRLNRENGEPILKGSDLVFGAVDNREARLILEGLCKELGITLIDGAIGGWYGQITVVKPGEDTLSKIYFEETHGEELELGNPAFICATVASIQVAEGLKELLGKGDICKGRVLTVDMLNHCYEKIEI